MQDSLLIFVAGNIVMNEYKYVKWTNKMLNEMGPGVPEELWSWTNLSKIAKFIISPLKVKRFSTTNRVYLFAYVIICSGNVEKGYRRRF